MPLLDLSTIHGPGRFLSPRAFPETARWLPTNRFGLENYTGACLCFAGDMPVLCHAGASTEPVLDLMRSAGLPVASEIVRYRDEGDYVEAVRRLLASGLKAVTVYPTPERVLPQGTTWIPQALQARLNNKLNLPEIVPGHGVPQRMPIAGETLARTLERPGALPVVVKVATDLATGGGADVFLCFSRRHIRRAAARLGGADRLILEEYIPAVRNDCLHYAIDHAGLVSYLGTARQICDRHGVHLGNRVDVKDAGSPAAIELGLAIARTAGALGYVGLSGLDILTREDGKAFAIDLNFRPASSSAQILLRDFIFAARGKGLSRLSFCTFGGTLAEAARRLKPFIAADRILPLGGFDPGGGFGGAAPFLRLLAIGNDPVEIDSTFAELTGAGFTIGGWKPRRRIARMLGGLMSRSRKAAPC